MAPRSVVVVVAMDDVVVDVVVVVVIVVALEIRMSDDAVNRLAEILLSRSVRGAEGRPVAQVTLLTVLEKGRGGGEVQWALGVRWKTVGGERNLVRFRIIQ